MWRAAPETLQISEAVKKGKKWMSDRNNKQTNKNRKSEKQTSGEIEQKWFNDNGDK